MQQETVEDSIVSCFVYGNVLTNKKLFSIMDENV